MSFGCIPDSMQGGGHDPWAIPNSESTDSVFGIERSGFRDRAIPFSGSSDPVFGIERSKNITGGLYECYRRTVQA